MKFTIVEDNQMSRDVLSKTLSKFDFLSEVKIPQGFEEGIAAVQEEKPDLIFLDMELDGFSGFDFLSKINYKPLVIAVTGHEKFASRGFDYNFVDYLVKPIEAERLSSALMKVKDRLIQKSANFPNTVRLSSKPDFIFVRSNSVLTKIKVNEIDYVQAAGDYVNIYTKSKRYTVHITLRSLQEKLPEGKFYRLHRSYLVSLDQVDVIEEGTAYLDKHPIPIGEQYKKELLRKLNLI